MDFDNILFLQNEFDNGNILSINADEDIIDVDENDFEEIISLLALKNTVLFPGMIIPISLKRKKSLKLATSSFDDKKNIGIITQKSDETENPSFDDLYDIGTVARVLKILEMPDNSKTAIIQGIKRFRITERVSEKQNLKVKYKLLDEIVPEVLNVEFEAVVSSIKEIAIKIIELSAKIPDEASFAIKNISKPEFLINMVASNSSIETSEKQIILEVDDLKEKGELLLSALTGELQKLEIKNNIQSKAKNEMDQNQREYFLNMQLKAIQDELGVSSHSHEIEELERKAKKLKWDKNVEQVFKKQISRLKQTNPMSPDFSYQLTYAQILVELPWNKCTKDNFDLKRAQGILDEDHFGLEKVKERIIEHLAVLKLKGNLKAPILCLYGPPGVGKTSLGKSVARALNRKYARMSLGGLHDEAEIRGHRKTYIGAMPGRIIQNLKKVKSSNPVFILDEIDKVGNDFRGDPSSALLEVLDPEQNKTFYDNYLELEYDLSKVMFIATANNLSTIKPALLDRMELINISGYIIQEKIQIAKRHLIPDQLKEHGVKKNQVEFTDSAIEEIISKYTRESGVRSLNKKIAETIRKIAKKIALDEKYDKSLTAKDINELLGVPPFQKETYEGNDYPGVVTGLAWTSAGGTILYVESSINTGNGKLTLTGNLGDVMKESAVIAHEYIKTNSKELGIDEDTIKNSNIHIHVPEGAVPKDGPSAGVAMVSSMTSAYTRKKIRKYVAMTGEISLRGKIMPVGGIKEKILAAKRAGIREIVLSSENEKDVSDIKKIYLKGLKFKYVDDISELLDYVILKQKS